MSNVPQKFDAIIIDSDISSRTRLRQATIAVPTFGDVAYAQTFDNAMGKLGGGQKCDVVFIAQKFESIEVTNFIKASKETKQGQDAAYVLVLGDNSDKTTVANYVMHGADGFLFAPFSVDSLVEITTLAAKVRKERSATRERAAMKLLVSDLIAQIDTVAFLKSCQCDAGRSGKKMLELGNHVKGMPKDSQNTYFELLIEMFSAAPLPKKAFQAKMYSGASSRVKRRMAEKAVAEMEEAAKTEGSGEAPS